MTIHTRHHPTRELLWLSDIHLDRVDAETKRHFLDQLRGTRFDALLITGDISNAKQLVSHLKDISAAISERPAFFTLGNHDYFFSSMSEVDKVVAELCRHNRTLIPLGHGEVIQLSPSTALIGHRGWYDGRAGYGSKTHVKSPDHKWINDFRHLSKRKFFDRLRDLGEESAEYFRKVLPPALERNRILLVGTHVPPCYQALKFSGGHCRWEHQPFFANFAAGEVIIGISRDYPKCRITVHAGHSHSAAHARISPELDIQVAGAKIGMPSMQKILMID